MSKQNKQGRRNFNQTQDQTALQSGRNDIELGLAERIGNLMFFKQLSSRIPF
ncbi:hypothetical protein [Bacillus sp. FJAT-47783]|uniref:hypothetical protein n=1 Tax=Bacillus sp. FJAT-47783 TaxID=2922712 RepID=UPI001FAB64A5|nr:hypothetical protein [Bacillus sp. FJAT-47783]